MERRRGLRQAIVGVAPAAPGADDAARPQDSEVARNGRLGEVQQLDQVADAELTGRQQVGDPDPGGFAERAGEAIGLTGGRATADAAKSDRSEHIRHFEYDARDGNRPGS